MRTGIQHEVKTSIPIIYNKCYIDLHIQTTYDCNYKELLTHQLYGAQANKIVRIRKIQLHISALECLNNQLLQTLN